MGALTTHVLDTAHGRPAANVKVSLFRIGNARELLKIDQTNTDGRLEAPILDADDYSPGVYELLFEAGDYFRSCGLELSEPPFVDQVVIRFGIGETDSHYHVPLLVSPWSYSTYRGS